MIILEGNTTQQTQRPTEKVCGEAYTSSQRASADTRSQSWNRIREQATKRGARKSMLGWLERKATESIHEAECVFERAAAVAKPQIRSASRITLQAAGNLSEGLGNKLLKLSKAARIAALRNMPHKDVAKLLLELERERALQAIPSQTPDPFAEPPQKQ